MKETILLVDDEQGIRTVMGLSLRDAGYNVITVASGEEALQLFAERPIPIVITDIRMPGMNGLDLLKHIKILAPETAQAGSVRLHHQTHRRRSAAHFPETRP